MNKYLKFIGLIGCLATVQAADGKRLAFKESPDVIVVDPALEEKWEIADSLLKFLQPDHQFYPIREQDVEQLYRLNVLLSKCGNFCLRALENSRERYVDDNVEVPRFLLASDIKKLLDSKLSQSIEMGPGNKEFSRINWQADSTGISYKESRISGLGNIVPVLKFMASQPNIIAIAEDVLPNTAEGTNAVPKIDVRYEFYQIPHYFMLALEQYSPVILNRLIEVCKLERLTYAAVAAMTGDDSVWLEAKTVAEQKKGKLVLSTIFSQYTAELDDKTLQEEAKSHLAKKFDAAITKYKSVEGLDRAESSSSEHHEIKRTKASRSLSVSAADAKKEGRPRTGSIVSKKV